MKRKHLRFGKGFRIAIGNSRSQAAEMVIEPGGAEGGATNRHRGADQWLYVVAGRGEIRINGKRQALSSGTVVLIERGDRHEVKNTGRALLRTINVYVPPAYTNSGEETSRARP